MYDNGGRIGKEVFTTISVRDTLGFFLALHLLEKWRMVRIVLHLFRMRTW